MRLVRVVNQTRNTVVGDRIELAETSFGRMRGLLGRTGINAGGGLWITPSSGVHTLGMKFAIDVVGLDARKRVVRVWPRLVPFRITAISVRTHSVIELAAGTIDSAHIEVGDLFEIAVVSEDGASASVSLTAATLIDEGKGLFPLTS